MGRKSKKEIQMWEEIVDLKKQGKHKQANALLAIYKMEYVDIDGDADLDIQVFDDLVEEYCLEYDATLFDRYF